MTAGCVSVHGSIYFKGGKALGSAFESDSLCMRAQLLSPGWLWLFGTPWTVAHQAPLFMGFPRQEYWSELPFPPPGQLPNSGTKPPSLAAPALAGELYHWATWEAPDLTYTLSFEAIYWIIIRFKIDYACGVFNTYHIPENVNFYC